MIIGWKDIVSRDQRRRDEAREFFLIRQSGQEFAPALVRKWTKWSADARNLAEYREYDRLGVMLRALPAQPLPSDAELLEDASPLEILVRRLWDPLWESRPGRVACVLTLCAILAVAVLTLVNPRALLSPGTASVQPRVYRTGPGGHLDVNLDDGSIINLGGSTTVSVSCCQKMRTASLREGEAYFQIAHDASNPFEVDVGAARIIDRGTKFNVRRYADQQVVVAVDDGAIDFSPMGAGFPSDLSAVSQSGSVTRLPSVTVRKGEEASADAKGTVTAAHPVDLHAVTLWLYGHRVYRDKPLTKVIEDVQLYSPRQIEFDPRLSSFLFTGYIDQSQPEKWVRGLPKVFPVVIDDTSSDRLIIRCRLSGCRLP